MLRRTLFSSAGAALAALNPVRSAGAAGPTPQHAAPKAPPRRTPASNAATYAIGAGGRFRDINAAVAAARADATVIASGKALRDMVFEITAGGVSVSTPQAIEGFDPAGFGIFIQAAPKASFMTLQGNGGPVYPDPSRGAFIHLVGKIGISVGIDGVNFHGVQIFRTRCGPAGGALLHFAADAGAVLRTDNCIFLDDGQTHRAPMIIASIQQTTTQPWPKVMLVNVLMVGIASDGFPYQDTLFIATKPQGRTGANGPYPDQSASIQMWGVTMAEVNTRPLLGGLGLETTSPETVVINSACIGTTGLSVGLDNQAIGSKVGGDFKRNINRYLQPPHRPTDGQPVRYASNNATGSTSFSDAAFSANGLVNVTIEKCFVSTRDFRLPATSPLRGAGIPGVLEADILGRARSTTAPSIGCLEYQQLA
jgi:hypothetical protein